METRLAHPGTAIGVLRLAFISSILVIAVWPDIAGAGTKPVFARSATDQVAQLSPEERKFLEERSRVTKEKVEAVKKLQRQKARELRTKRRPPRKPGGNNPGFGARAR